MRRSHRAFLLPLIPLAAAACLATAIAAPQSPQSSTVVIGGVAKRTTGVVRALEAGDVACHLRLTDDDGREFEELADFPICERRGLIGQRVTLRYRTEKVMADSCQGDPSCTATRSVALVVAATAAPGASAPPARATAAPAQTSFCTPLETPVFACPVGRKLVSVCASKDASSTAGYVQYRFGSTDGLMEMTLPEGEVVPSAAATGDTMAFSGGGGAWMRFRNRDTAYVVCTAIGKWGPNSATRERAGVAVERAGRAPMYLPCSGAVASDLGPDWFAQHGVTSKGEDFKLPDRAPAPTVERAAFRIAAPAPAPRTDLEIQSASLSFDPNATHWYVTSKVCNNAEGGHSGSLQYEL
jgi:hypothetical protein